ncbi:hypothetical protein [Lactobacillus sp. 3B(2020)]|uniref:hypothetical protein n=1 Tax=Lactobacillus sp. 3B(2020) TaxID=2695882 RepID=UPI0015DFE68C|nr:hypothetical protein [Lactobacillus sp. 3B(2020)]QLL69804.1 hypothetical protein GTO83_04265 [Lactobacillus sp. 3B(2020)]
MKNELKYGAMVLAKENLKQKMGVSEIILTKQDVEMMSSDLKEEFEATGKAVADTKDTDLFIYAYGNEKFVPVFDVIGSDALIEDYAEEVMFDEDEEAELKKARDLFCQIANAASEKAILDLVAPLTKPYFKVSVSTKNYVLITAIVSEINAKYLGYPMQFKAIYDQDGYPKLMVNNTTIEQAIEDGLLKGLDLDYLENQEAKFNELSLAK